MAEPLTCPHCQRELTEPQIRSLNGRMNRRMRGKPKPAPIGSLGVSLDDLPSNADRLTAARQHSNAVLNVGPENERVYVPIEET